MDFSGVWEHAYVPDMALSNATNAAMQKELAEMARAIVDAPTVLIALATLVLLGTLLFRVRPPRVILGLLSAHLTPAEARDRGLTITGDPALLRRLQPDRRAIGRSGGGRRRCGSRGSRHPARAGRSAAARRRRRRSGR